MPEEKKADPENINLLDYEGIESTLGVLAK
jgi:hypothetical protein